VKLKILTTVTLIGLLIATVGCGKAPEQKVSAETKEIVLKVSGSGTASGVLAAIAPAFEANVPGYTLNVLPGSGTGGGVKGTIEGVLDVAAMLRAPTEEEEPQIDYQSFGLGAEIPIAHADLDLTSLTAEQLTAIFCGEVTNWSQVGGPDEDIVVYVRGSDSAHTKAVRRGVFGDAPFAETAKVMGSLGDMLAAVEGTPNSVGFANWPGALSKGAQVDFVAVGGVGPDDPSYPGVLPLGIGYLPDRQADVQPLIDWLLSEQGQVALAEAGVIVGAQ
jgi:phosphate transport system substrate-binding protein